MTPRQLYRRVEYWQRKLKGLGFEHWRVTVTVSTELEATDTDARDGLDPVAYADVSHYYDTVDFEFRKDMLDKPQDEIDELIVHEWLHVWDRDREQGEVELFRYLSEDARQAERDRVCAAKEGQIDRMARVLVALSK
jgi:hypothetical protein